MAFRWERYGDEKLLDLRLCDLRLRIEGTWLLPLTERIGRELWRQGIVFRPHYWLADEWFSPDGVPGVAIPFYLASKRLMRIEGAQMFEVEGGTRREALRLLRHEVGHAIDSAYRLHRTKRWRKAFGRFSDPYPEHYRPRPSSRAFVQHLDGWYAQSHPAEDWAETFAVWLDPRSRWRERYASWPAIQKLRCVDRLMSEIKGKKPKVVNRRKPYSLARLRHTLRTHYARKRDHYLATYSEAWDRDLRRVFSDAQEHRKNPSAAVWLRRNRRRIRELVTRWTGGYEFTLDHVLNEMIGRCRELNLRLVEDEEQTRVDFAIMVAINAVHYLHRGDEWHPL